MTQINLPYGNGLLAINIPDTFLGEVVSPHSVMAASDPEDMIQTPLAKPIGTPPLEQMVNKDQKIAVIIDDITRETPANLMLSPVLNKLLAAGVARNDISIVIALGTHHPMTETEIIKKTGAAIANDFEILNVPSWVESQMVYNEVYRCVAGDFIRAHRTGVTYSQEVYGVLTHGGVTLPLLPAG